MRQANKEILLFLEKIVAHTMMISMMITSMKEDHLGLEIEMMSEDEDMKTDEAAIEEDRIMMTKGDLPLMRDEEMRIKRHPPTSENSHRIWMINVMKIGGEIIMI